MRQGEKADLLFFIFLERVRIDKMETSDTILNMEWNDQFLALFDSCLSEYNSGNSNFQSYYTEDDLGFLKIIGYKPRELFDFVEDLADCGAPSRSAALLVAAVRRDYFLVVQNGQASSTELDSADFPAKTDTLAGIPYFTRLVKKAKAKLRGELHPNLMFGCAGDRNFLKSHGNIPIADFLRNVWSAGEDEERIVAYVLSYKNSNA